MNIIVLFDLGKALKTVGLLWRIPLPQGKMSAVLGTTVADRQPYDHAPALLLSSHHPCSASVQLY